MTDSRPDVPNVAISITYEHRYRTVYATSVFKSQAGHWCITAWDPDAEDGEGGYRTFREDRIKGGRIRFVKDTLENQ